MSERNVCQGIEGFYFIFRRHASRTLLHHHCVHGALSGSYGPFHRSTADQFSLFLKINVGPGLHCCQGSYCYHCHVSVIANVIVPQSVIREEVLGVSPDSASRRLPRAHSRRSLLIFCSLSRQISGSYLDSIPSKSFPIRHSSYHSVLCSQDRESDVK